MKPIKLQFYDDLAGKEIYGRGATPDKAGMAMRHPDTKDLSVVLPCGHFWRAQGAWAIEDFEDNDKITVSPSILCLGTSQDNSECWHGYIRNGNLVL